MTTHRDLIDLADALDCIEAGAPPTWFPPQTKTGERAQKIAQKLRTKYIRALFAASAADAAQIAYQKRQQEFLDHCQALTDRALQAEKALEDHLATCPTRSNKKP